MDMNLVTQLFGVALNILFSPFSTQIINETTTTTTTSTIKTATTLQQPSSSSSPNNLNWSLGGFVENFTGVKTCDTVLLKMGENEMKVSLAPRGYCRNCCPVKTGSHVRFILYGGRRGSNNSKGVIIEPTFKKGAAFNAGVDNLLSTEIFIHGFSEPSPGQSGKAITEAYLSRSDRNFNVILVDWSELSRFPWYRNSVDNMKIVAKLLKKFLEKFNDSGEIPIHLVHIIGFSLGSHIASYTGKLLRKDLRIPRITALDPAFPEFGVQDTSQRLTKSDAEYIDVIHTDAGILGLPISVGHADFYPNGGRALQPGCQPSHLVEIRLFDQILACSHVRAWRLYAESIRNENAFPSTKCRIWRGPNKICNYTLDAYMGFANKNKTHGKFYLVTNFQMPYSKTVEQQIVQP